jgi:chorismate-pyruvate lyase
MIAILRMETSVKDRIIKTSRLERQTGWEADDLFSLFPTTDYLTSVEAVPAEQLPLPYQSLLIHPFHMTVTVEAHHGEKVDVKILQQIRDVDIYARKILLVTQKSQRVVQFGLVRIQLQYCSAAVREEILSGKTPLGRILIQHNVLRRIEPIEFLRVIPGAAMMKWFGLTRPQPTYGRLALIHCDGKPAIELVEIVAPETIV